MSLTFPRRWLVPLAAAAALGLSATSATADQVRHREWWLGTVHTAAAWQTSRGAGVTVAVLDSGVDPAQPDLTRSVRAGPDYTRAGEAPGSAHRGGHGTAMAALIAGHGHGHGGSGGTMGIAPRARILSVRVVPDRGDPAFTSRAAGARLPGSIAAGIRYAVAHGATVIDLPLDPGTTDAAGDAGARGAGGGSAAERQAVSYALSKGAVLIGPAGDSRAHGGPVNYPAAYPGVVAVGAIDRDFDLARFSIRRPYVTVTGPGVDVFTAKPGSGYTSVTSTAAASAVAAGVATLVRAEYPSLQPRQVTQALTQGTLFRHPKRAGSGYGAVDAAGALRAAAAIAAASGKAASSPASRSAGTGASGNGAPAGFLGNTRRDLIGAVGAVAVIVAAALAGLAIRRRRRGRPSRGYGYDPAPDSPLSGGLSRLPPSGEDEGSPATARAGQDRRPRLAPVTGPWAPPGRNRRAADGPPWEDAPMPSPAAPDWSSPGSGPGWSSSGSGPGWSSASPAPGDWSAPGLGPEGPGASSGAEGPGASSGAEGPGGWSAANPAPGLEAESPHGLEAEHSPDDPQARRAQWPAADNGAPPWLREAGEPANAYPWSPPDHSPAPGPKSSWMENGGYHGAPGGAGTRNGHFPPGAHRPSAASDGEDTATFSAMPRASGRSTAAASGDQAPDEEDEQPFEDEDDRYL